MRTRIRNILSEATAFEDRPNINDAFWKWFGNSKVVDENGDPLIVYHGSPKEFSEFSYDFMNSTNEGYGFYFTNNEKIANGYGDRLYKVYLLITKPISLTKKTITKSQLRKFINMVDSSTEGDYLTNYGDVEFDGHTRVFNKAVELEYGGSDNDVDMICGIINAQGGSYLEMYRMLYKCCGFDGIIVGNAEWGDDYGGQSIYIPFFPEQIKSIDNSGTWDINNSDIMK